MNRLPFFLAQKLLFTNVYQKNISAMTTICFIGIFIGSFSLAIVTAIMRGFEITIHKKIQGIHAHVIIDAYGQPINFKALSRVLHHEFPEIAAFSPHSERQVLIRPHKKHDIIPTVVIIKSIKPDLEIKTSSLFTKIIMPTHLTDFQSLLSDNHLIIGKQYATNYQISLGDTLEILFAHDEHIKGNTVHFESQHATVSGIFDTGIDDFDSNIMYCSFPFLKKMFPDAAVEQINVTLHNTKNESSLIKKLHQRLGLSVYSWKDLYPSLVATLALEKYVSFFIITLIILVASMNIISLLHMQITQKRHEIALLKSMGMTNTAIRFIFFIAGLMISIIAALSGLISALLVGALIKRYPCITLPDSYYTTHLPIVMELTSFIIIFFIVLLCSTLAIYYSTKQISYINISHVLRFED